MQIVSFPTSSSGFVYIRNDKPILYHRWYLSCDDKVFNQGNVQNLSKINTHRLTKLILQICNTSSQMDLITLGKAFGLNIQLIVIFLSVKFV